jgi:hypothetical protein
MGKRSNEFQKLVHYIYSKISAPFKASESAMVRENGTGVEREIDILIEGAIAGIEVRIAVECRDRSRTDTIEWIDHLIGKYARLKVNKIVAVSSQGFSKDAERKAAEHGISLLKTEDAENVDWAKEIARPFFDVMTHSHTLLIIGGYDQHDKEILHIDIDQSYKPSHRDALSEAAYPALHRYFHEHLSKYADSQFNEKMMSENTWQKMFEDRRSRYWELACNLGLELRSKEGQCITISRLVFGIGTKFDFHKAETKSTVLGDHVLSETRLPTKDSPTVLRVVSERSKGMLSVEFSEEGVVDAAEDLRATTSLANEGEVR